jgi:AcrR family transcriptional regulator
MSGVDLPEITSPATLIVNSFDKALARSRLASTVSSTRLNDADLTVARQAVTTTSGRRLPRGSLTPDMIITESLRLLDRGGADGFSMPKLGRALGADPTAVYRHFASKDDLVLAIADRLIEEALTGLRPQACWLDFVEHAARRFRATYVAHPAAAALSCYRTTQGPAEIRAVDLLIGAVRQAGFEGAQAALVYRAIADFTLAWAGSEAAFLALDADLQQADRSAWSRTYRAVDRDDYPHVWSLRDELAGVRDDDVFETVLSCFLEGLRKKAPNPCGCHKHADPGQRADHDAPP